MNKPNPSNTDLRRIISHLEESQTRLTQLLGTHHRLQCVVNRLSLCCRIIFVNFCKTVIGRPETTAASHFERMLTKPEAEPITVDPARSRFVCEVYIQPGPLLRDTKNSPYTMTMASTLQADPDRNGHILAMPMSLYKRHCLMGTSTWKRNSRHRTDSLWEPENQIRPEYFQLHTDRTEFATPKIAPKCFTFAWLTSKNKLKDAEPMDSTTSFFFRLAQQKLRRHPNPNRTQRIWTHSQTTNDLPQSMTKRTKRVKRSSLEDEPTIDHIHYSQPQQGPRRPPSTAAFESISNTLLRCHTIDECPERRIERRNRSRLSDDHTGLPGNIKVIENRFRTSD
ncbi:hypothetical protein PHET_04127 [Paragonimus heterotremus]|uniref:Uncharacterized protein n=1 Tax=Paragonimus heterotremus TaxID=100268 RepID=A0A8J4T287_9TREM|nr:hypothetical protein PHET_04127 [Paragonimus heterotremus]